MPLGLPLPPFAGKRRISFLVHPESVISISAACPRWGAARGAAPHAWWPTLDRLETAAARHSLEARIFGSLAWRSLTGLNYLTNSSDLDVLLDVHRDTDLYSLAAGVAAIDAAAPHAA